LSFSVLGSGSSGNATFIKGTYTSILLDCGFSLPQIKKRLENIGKDIEEIEAVFITHEHVDHICGLKRLLNMYDMPVFMTRGTYLALREVIGDSKKIQVFEAGSAFHLKEFHIQSFSVTHDAKDPVNYVITNNKAKLGFATDCGYPSRLIMNRLQGCQGLIIESNYCPNMLMKGTYPPQIKQRIQSRFGHLSNQQMLQLLCNIIDERLRAIVLAHISENNNHYELVEQLVRQALGKRDVQLWISNQTHPTPLIHLS